jgi:hypothetical protein
MFYNLPNNFFLCGLLQKQKQPHKQTPFKIWRFYPWEIQELDNRDHHWSQKQLSITLLCLQIEFCAKKQTTNRRNINYYQNSKTVG